MIVFTEREKKKLKDYVVIIVVGIALAKFRGWDVFTAMGYVFTVLVCVDAITSLLGHILARVAFIEVFPKSVKELKHSDKQYQYIIKTDKREIYTHVYNVPLEKVKVRCWSLLGSYLIEVTRKRSEKNERKKD